MKGITLRLRPLRGINSLPPHPLLPCPATRPDALSTGLNFHFGMRATERHMKCDQYVTVTYVQHSPQTGVPVALRAEPRCCGSVGVDVGAGAGVGDDADDSHNA